MGRRTTWTPDDGWNLPALNKPELRAFFDLLHRNCPTPDLHPADPWTVDHLNFQFRLRGTP